MTGARGSIEHSSADTSRSAFDGPDDLSEELTDPGLVPPEFRMPSPDIGPSGGDFSDTDTDTADTLSPEPSDERVAAGDVEGRRSPRPARKRRRSLLNP